MKLRMALSVVAVNAAVVGSIPDLYLLPQTTSWQIFAEQCLLAANFAFF
jgi:hypothetical protein